MSIAPDLNTDLLDLTLTYTKEHPQDWFQDRYRCASGLCFAGNAAMLAGGTFPYRVNDLHEIDINDDQWAGMAEAREVVETPDGEFLHIDTFAKRALGLTDSEGDTLFAFGNTLGAIETAIDEIKDMRRIQDAA